MKHPMKIFKTILTAACIFGISAGAAQAITTQGTASTRLIGPIVIKETRPMSFGRIFAAGDSHIPVTVSTDYQEGEVHDGLFEITSEPYRQYYTAVASSVTLYDNAGHSLTASLRLVTPSDNYNYSGTDVMRVAGTLYVPADQSPGDYTGTYAVYAHY